MRIFCPNSRHGRLAPAVSLLVPLCFGCGGATAAQPASSAQPAQASAQAEAPAARASEPDRYKVPDGNVQELQQFIRRMRSEPLEGETRDEQIASLVERLPAIREAADRILALDASPSVHQAAAEEKFRAGIELTFSGKVSFDDIIAELRAYVVPRGPSKHTADMVMRVGRYFERRVDPATAADIYREYSALFAAASDAPDHAFLAARLEGAARRTSLVKDPMRVWGRRLDGTEFALSAYEGRVVLVEFWATWCKPCIAGLPNMKTNYEKYHDRGFDIVSISIDEHRGLVEAFVNSRAVPWTVLFHERASDDEHNPVAEYYGVEGIPVAILLGRDRRAVSLDARGDELTRRLEEMFGEAERPVGE